MFHSIFTAIAKVLIAPTIFLMSLAGYGTQTEAPVLTNLGGFSVTAGGTYRLGNSISSTDTSIKLSSFTEPISLTKYTMAMLNTDIAYGTIAPQSTQSELVSFTGITQNADGSATLTGVSRGLSRSYPYTASSTFRMAHAGQSIFILSDAPGLFNEYVTKRNDETISGAKTFTATSTFASTTLVTTTPTSANMVANKSYVDTSIASATSTINTDVVHKAGTETITGDKTFSGTTALASTTVSGTLGVTGIATFTAVPVSATNPSNGNQVANKDYVDGVAIAGAPISDNTTTGIGRTASSTQIASGYASTTPYFIPSSLASSTASTTASIVVVANSSGKIDNSFLTAPSVTTPVVRTYLTAASPATWTKPAGLKYVIVEVQAGGGGSGGVSIPNSGNEGAGGSGGGGGYSKKLIATATLGATETVTIGAGGTAAGTSGTAGTGGTSSFGSHLSANGGTGGASSGNNGSGSGVSGTGGTATGGDINISGGSPAFNHRADGENFVTTDGGNSILGQGGAGADASDAASGSVGNLYGGGASGSKSQYNDGAVNGVAGAAGIVIVTEYYF